MPFTQGNYIDILSQRNNIDCATADSFNNYFIESVYILLYGVTVMINNDLDIQYTIPLVSSSFKWEPLNICNNIIGIVNSFKSSTSKNKYE